MRCIVLLVAAPSQATVYGSEGPGRPGMVCAGRLVNSGFRGKLPYTVNNQEVAVSPGSRRFSLFPLPCALGSSCTSEVLLYYVNELSGQQYALFGLTRQHVPLSCNVSFAGGAGKLQLEQRAQLDTSNFSSRSISRILWNVYKHTLCVHLSVYKLPTMRMDHAGKSGNFLGVGILNQPL